MADQQEARVPSATLQKEMQHAHTFTVAGHEYRAKALKPFEQIHLVRRLAPLVLGALRPEAGRDEILKRLTVFAGVGQGPSSAGAPTSSAESGAENDQLAKAALEIATSVLEAAAAIDQKAFDTILRLILSKMHRVTDGGVPMPIWYDRNGHDMPSFPDIDGFTVLVLAGRYLAAEFSGKITEYVASLGLKPGPALAAAVAVAPVAARPQR